MIIVLLTTEIAITLVGHAVSSELPERPFVRGRKATDRANPCLTVQRETSVLFPREYSESDLTFDLLELRLANARDSNEIFEVLETTIGFTELNNPLRQHRSDSPNAFKFTRVSLIETDQNLLVGRLWGGRGGL